MQNSILVTGGAGYIGSHVVRQLVERGERVVVLDNLSSGYRAAVLGAPLVVGDTADRAAVDRLLAGHGVETVMHFAAHTIVPESVSNPLKYYGNNTCATRNLLECCDRAGVKHVVFSSTAAVYGIPSEGVAREESPTVPINPYGLSKLMSEWMLRDLAAASALRYVALRYFNVAGSDPGGRIGHTAPNATLLVKVACQQAVGVRPSISIFGTDTRRRTARACATTSTSRTWPPRTSRPWTTFGPAAIRRPSTAVTVTGTASGTYCRWSSASMRARH